MLQTDDRPAVSPSPSCGSEGGEPVLLDLLQRLKVARELGLQRDELVDSLPARVIVLHQPASRLLLREVERAGADSELMTSGAAGARTLL